MTQLWMVEHHLDGLLQKVVDGLTEEQLTRAMDRFDELILAFPELRLSSVDAHPKQAAQLLTRLDLEGGPLPGFEAAMTELCERCVKPEALQQLRSQLYKAAARAADTVPDLVPTIAIACLSLDTCEKTRNAFIEMVICVSAIESLIRAGSQDDKAPCLEISSWLAVDPSEALIQAVGEGKAYYYAAIAGVLPFLDQSRVLFDIEQLTTCARATKIRLQTDVVHGLDVLINPTYKALLASEIQRTQQTLRQCYPSHSIADVEMLTRRALDALDELPAEVNPLLQAIFVQSWVKCLYDVC
jgi:hypothetical protein